MSDIKIHRFETSGEAYDACQCDEEICDGDVLLIEREGVVGVAHTWPVAVTAKRGELHTLDTHATVEAWSHGSPGLLKGWDAAVEVARKKGLLLCRPGGR